MEKRANLSLLALCTYGNFRTHARHEREREREVLMDEERERRRVVKLEAELGDCGYKQLAS